MGVIVSVWMGRRLRLEGTAAAPLLNCLFLMLVLMQSGVMVLWSRPGLLPLPVCLAVH